MKIDKKPLLYAGSSVLALLIDKGIFFLTQLVVRGAYSVLISNTLARIVSSLVNFILNRLIFKKGNSAGGKYAIVKYYTLVVVQLILVSTIETFLIRLLGIEHAGLKTLLTLPVDGAAFCVNYIIQKNWVFKEKDTKNGNES